MKTHRPEILTRSGNPVDYLSDRCGDKMPLAKFGDAVLYHEYGAQLRIGLDGTHILNVLCGRILEYGVEVALTPEEIQRYRSEGDVFVHNLSEKIHDYPELFEFRVIRKC